jgi:hypothetical protein
VTETEALVPKRRLRFKMRMLECAACGGFHAHWWLTSKVAPPGCAERQKRSKRR